MDTREFNEIISEIEYKWVNNYLSPNRISKRKTYKSWKIPSIFENYYEDKTNRYFEISFPKSADIEPIIGFFLINSGREIQFPPSVEKLCQVVAQELGDDFVINFQALDINKDILEKEGVSGLNIAVERIVKQRTQQKRYRQDLIDLWSGRCVLTDIDFGPILTASHIKRFSLCNENEAYDPANGLLLSAHIDKLFDQGFITFNNEGEIIYSKYLPNGLKEKIGIPSKAKILFKNLTQNKKNEILNYIKFHREEIFKK
ncbi:hypothetical protein A7P89_11510 [Eikenella corrodens]|uniref:HNH nuclease domain-containing protein n=1 Tax=Eikenella corrodens TaxID=539 RepID=A0A1A9RLM3_EIKCO|nr:HNH endonuclease signature motif containing protein [Eikenella corrodens]OAM19708.1 hypothetical protein A7P89_11510 [Eikenella corrodens]